MTLSLFAPRRICASAEFEKNLGGTPVGRGLGHGPMLAASQRNTRDYACVGGCRNLSTSDRARVSKQGSFRKECAMIRLLVLMLSAALLGGCVVVPAGYATYDDGYYHHHRYYHSYAYDYRYGRDHGQ
jgi:hypothetical protein